jgi:PPM family protein phosphatase
MVSYQIFTVCFPLKNVENRSTMNMQSFGITDKGCIRTNNEDSFLIDGNFLIVADGMGGAAAGEVASSMAINIISTAVKEQKTSSWKKAMEILKTAIEQADSEIKAASRKNSGLEGMGTTVVTALFLDTLLLIGFVGDSRAYAVSNEGEDTVAPEVSASSNNGDTQTVILKNIDEETEMPQTRQIRRLTDDHSVVMELVQAGVITEEEIRSHPLRNRITRCIGSLKEKEPEFVWYNPRPGETLILCSDGLWEMVHEDLILAIIKSSHKPKEMCQRLVNAANDAGGYDNITVIAAQFR